jgi:hypothetical protein
MSDREQQQGGDQKRASSFAHGLPLFTADDCRGRKNRHQRERFCASMDHTFTLSLIELRAGLVPRTERQALMLADSQSTTAAAKWPRQHSF